MREDWPVRDHAQPKIHPTCSIVMRHAAEGNKRRSSSIDLKPDQKLQTSSGLVVGNLGSALTFWRERRQGKGPKNKLTFGRIKTIVLSVWHSPKFECPTGYHPTSVHFVHTDCSCAGLLQRAIWKSGLAVHTQIVTMSSGHFLISACVSEANNTRTCKSSTCDTVWNRALGQGV